MLIGTISCLEFNNVLVAFQATGNLMIPNGYGVDIEKSLFMKENIELQPLDMHMEQFLWVGQVIQL